MQAAKEKDIQIVLKWSVALWEKRVLLLIASEDCWFKQHNAYWLLGYLLCAGGI